MKNTHKQQNAQNSAADKNKRDGEQISRYIAEGNPNTEKKLKQAAHKYDDYFGTC